MLFFDRAFLRREAAPQIGEEATVALFDVGVPVAFRMGQSGRCSDAANRWLRSRGTPRGNARPPSPTWRSESVRLPPDSGGSGSRAGPERALPAKDIEVGSGCRPLRSPEDAIRVWAFWRRELGDLAVVAVQRLTVVIPVRRHRQCVPDLDPEQRCTHPRRKIGCQWGDCVGFRFQGKWLVDEVFTATDDPTILRQAVAIGSTH